MSMVTSTTWVPRGFAAPFPTKYNFDEDEFERIAALAKLQLEEAQEELDEAQENEAEAKKAEKSAKKSETKSKPDAAEESVFPPHCDLQTQSQTTNTKTAVSRSTTT